MTSHTNWPPIFAAVSEWTECPKGCSLEERAAFIARGFKCRSGDDAEFILYHLQAVAPKVEADPELAKFSPAVKEYPIAMIFPDIWYWITADEARKRYSALGAVLQEADDA